MSLDQNKIEEVLFENCEGVNWKRGEWNMRCPFCGDSKKSKRIKRFYLFWYPQYGTWLYKCYNGGCEANEPGDVVSLVAYLKGISYSQAKKLVGDDTYDSKAVRKKLKGEEKVVEEKPKQEQNVDINLELECYGVNDEPDDRIGQRYVKALREWVKERKVPIECFVAHSGRYKNRFIIPIYINGVFVYFQARRMISDMEPKFLNPIMEKEHHILNVDKFDRDKYIIVTEGLMDALMVNYNQGTSPLGGTISDELLKILFLYTDKGIILALDNWKIDKPARKILERFVGIQSNDRKGIGKSKKITPSYYCQKVKYFVMPDKYNIKDMNQLVIETNIKDVYDFVEKNSISYLKLVTKLQLGL